MRTSGKSVAEELLPAVGVAAGALAHSLWARGARQTALFAGLGLGLPALGEYIGVNRARVVRHHTRPQVLGVPVPALLDWYAITYATYATLEGILAPNVKRNAAWRWALPVGTAAVATNLDMALDVFGLASGYWEWSTHGPYAAEVLGPNGKHGIPTANFTAWIALTGAVTSAYTLLARHAGSESPMKERPASGRVASLFLAACYLQSALWLIANRKQRYLAYSGLVPLTIAAAWWRGRKQ